jgi:hypothetical protein
MTRHIKVFAKKTGYKEKGGMWYDRQGFPVSESEIVDYYNAITKIIFEKQQEEFIQRMEVTSGKTDCQTA